MPENVKVLLSYAYLLSSAAFIPSPSVIFWASKNTVCAFGGWQLRFSHFLFESQRIIITHVLLQLGVNRKSVKTLYKIYYDAIFGYLFLKVLDLSYLKNRNTSQHFTSTSTVVIKLVENWPLFFFFVPLFHHSITIHRFASSFWTLI